MLSSFVDSSPEMSLDLSLPLMPLPLFKDPSYQHPGLLFKPLTGFLPILNRSARFNLWKPSSDLVTFVLQPPSASPYMMDGLRSKPHLRDFHKLITNLLYSIICHPLLMWSLNTSQTSLSAIFRHTMTLAPCACGVSPFYSLAYQNPTQRCFLWDVFLRCPSPPPW